VAERPWGFWTESKLHMLSDYLPAFATASKRAPSTVYLDLFAGQAENVSRETGQPIAGSLLRALRTEPPFTVVRGFEPFRYTYSDQGCGDASRAPVVLTLREAVDGGSRSVVSAIPGQARDKHVRAAWDALAARGVVAPRDKSLRRLDQAKLRRSGS
jgi:three-Cys-motif partner protein